LNLKERMALPMLSVDEALETILSATTPLPVEAVKLKDVSGRYLAGEVRASRDMPPFDRTAMDGFALRAIDTQGAPVDLEIIEDIAAGHDPLKPVAPGQASRIMTGAAIPAGADAVVMVEKTRTSSDKGRVTIQAAADPGQHIRRAGEDIREGELLFGPGTFLSAAAVALLAAEGKSRVQVGGRPAISVLSTGDELVEIAQTPGSSQIRDTNSWTLLSMLHGMGLEGKRLGIAPDSEPELAALIADGMSSDILLITGGVSMGEHDLVGAQLHLAGCSPAFQRVAIQPGKPLYFGANKTEKTLVFGLPGNPVSTLVDFLVFVKPAILKMMGASQPLETHFQAKLTSPIRRRPGRRGYLPGRVGSNSSGELEARLISSKGSADIVALSKANALLIAPEDEGELAEGSVVSYLPLAGAGVPRS
jgi:molybdopterin molybdotransferase